MPLLLDTNILSDLVHDPHGRVARAISRVGESEVATSVIVAAELRYGATTKGSPRLTAQVEAILGALPSCPSTLRPTGSTASCAPSWSGPVA